MWPESALIETTVFTGEEIRGRFHPQLTRYRKKRLEKSEEQKDTILAIFKSIRFIDKNDVITVYSIKKVLFE